MIFTIWSDFACPFCYIGETNLEKALGQLGITDATVNYMAYQLDPDMAPDAVEPAVEHFEKKFGMDAGRARARVRKIEGIAREAGLDFNYGNAKYCNTFDAHRLVKYAGAHDAAKVRDLVHALFKAFFTDGKVLNDRDTLADIAAESGYDRDDVRAMLDTDKFADDVKTNEYVAHLQGIQGVPYIVINDRVAVPGALPPEDFKKAIAQAAGSDDGSEAPGAHKCGPEGCEI